MKLRRSGADLARRGAIRDARGRSDEPFTLHRRRLGAYRPRQGGRGGPGAPDRPGRPAPPAPGLRTGIRRGPANAGVRGPAHTLRAGRLLANVSARPGLLPNPRSSRPLPSPACADAEGGSLIARASGSGSPRRPATPMKNRELWVRPLWAIVARAKRPPKSSRAPGELMGKSLAPEGFNDEFGESAGLRGQEAARWVIQR